MGQTYPGLKKGQKSKDLRNFRPEDMVSWDDGHLMCDASLSVQITAAIQTQLDCGYWAPHVGYWALYVEY